MDAFTEPFETIEHVGGDWVRLEGGTLDLGSVLDGVGMGASLSGDGVYRYDLWRSWGPAQRMGFVLLNPSTADASVDDATIRRCVGFAKREGYDGIRVVNLFAFRATDPSELRRVTDPVGPDNDEWLTRLALDTSRCGLVVAGWGAPGRWAQPRIEAVELLMHDAGRPLYALGRTVEGQPRHPLYLPKVAALSRYRP